MPRTEAGHALGFCSGQRVHVRTNTAPTGHNMRRNNALLTRIAQRTLHIETLAPQGSDRLDFHEVSVESLRDALQAAYDAGLEQGRKQRDAVDGGT
jgi:hypothetical protein